MSKGMTRTYVQKKRM